MHYLRWELTPEQVDSFASGPVLVEIDHPEYLEVVELLDSTRDELLGRPARLTIAAGVVRPRQLFWRAVPLRL